MTFIVTLLTVAVICRRKVLQVWKAKEGPNATYRQLLEKCVEGRAARVARKICEVVAHADPPCLGRQQQQGNIMNSMHGKNIIVRHRFRCACFPSLIDIMHA